MNEAQRLKRNFRNTKAFKEHKEKKKKECGGIDKITNHKLRKGWSLHHEDLREENYKILNDNFLPCNNLTHKFIHWIWQYYLVDEEIIDRLKEELDRMKEINQGGGNGALCKKECKTGCEEIKKSRNVVQTNHRRTKER